MSDQGETALFLGNLYQIRTGQLEKLFEKCHGDSWKSIAVAVQNTRSQGEAEKLLEALLAQEEDPGVVARKMSVEEILLSTTSLTGGVGTVP